MQSVLAETLAREILLLDKAVYLCYKGGDTKPLYMRARGMAFHFKFNGGSNKPTQHTMEKFFMFFVVGGEEIPFHQMVRDGLVWRDYDNSDSFSYLTSHSIAKVFTSHQGFGIEKRYMSLYFRMLESASAEVTIHPFTGEQSRHFFTSHVTFLKKSQVLALLDEQSDSYFWAKRMPPPRKEVLRQIVKVDRTAMKKNVRKILIGRKRRVANSNGDHVELDDLV